MPVYEYKCQDCGVIVEDTRRADERLFSMDCPDCDGSCYLIMSRTSFKLKGDWSY